ncbi:MAG: hypothetical protein HY245_04680, partial [Rhizobiales bacterium]|nr:hypothetical protein [Hyphomicrobiales bacterium]
AAAFFGQKLLNQPTATAAALGVICFLAWLALLLTMTLSASLYSYYGETRDFPSPR